MFYYISFRYQGGGGLAMSQGYFKINICNTIFIVHTYIFYVNNYKLSDDLLS